MERPRVCRRGRAARSPVNRRRFGGSDHVGRIDPRFLFGTRSAGHGILAWCGRLGDQHRLALKSTGFVPWQHFHAVRSRRIDCDMRKDRKVHAFRQSRNYYRQLQARLSTVQRHGYRALSCTETIGLGIDRAHRPTSMHGYLASLLIGWRLRLDRRHFRVAAIKRIKAHNRYRRSHVGAPRRVSAL